MMKRKAKIRRAHKKARMVKKSSPAHKQKIRVKESIQKSYSSVDEMWKGAENDDFKDVTITAEQSLKKVWNNKHDEQWNKYGQE